VLIGSVLRKQRGSDFLLFSSILGYLDTSGMLASTRDSENSTRLKDLIQILKTLPWISTICFIDWCPKAIPPFLAARNVTLCATEKFSQRTEQKIGTKKMS
jgi:hypothetical protein